MGTVYANGYANVTVAANEKIAIFSYASASLYKYVGYPNIPAELKLVEVTDAGEQYVSDAVTVETVFQIQAGASFVQYTTGAEPVVAEPVTDIAAADATFTITGLAAAQGGYVKSIGGTSSTSGNAGGEAGLLGGQPGATGIGGAATVTGAAGGATSGVGGAATVVGGAGAAGNSAGGVASVTGGAGQGSAAGGVGKTVGGAGGATGVGGAAQVTGGAGGATSGSGGDAVITGGAGTAGNGPGGSTILTPGAAHGSGVAGGNFLRSAGGLHFRQQTAPTAKSDGDQSITAAQMINGIVVHTVTTGRTLTTPTGAAILAGCPADIAAGDSFDLSVITVGTGADDISTLTAGDADVTFVGKVTVGPDTAAIAAYGTWRFRYTGANAFVGYRIA